MTRNIDIVELAHELAEIASRTNDAEASEKLMAIVNRILTKAGLAH